MVVVESSMIAAIGYTRGLLTVAFNNGTVYRYAKVPKAIYIEWLAAESKGRYFNSNIKHKYAYRRIE
jgi:hypothetical protein